jgi:hypothetical protein
MDTDVIGYDEFNPNKANSLVGNGCQVKRLPRITEDQHIILVRVRGTALASMGAISNGKRPA